MYHLFIDDPVKYTLPNCLISPADMITPTLPNVSAMTWRNTPGGQKYDNKMTTH